MMKKFELFSLQGVVAFIIFQIGCAAIFFESTNIVDKIQSYHERMVSDRQTHYLEQTSWDRVDTVNFSETDFQRIRINHALAVSKDNPKFDSLIASSWKYYPPLPERWLTVQGQERIQLQKLVHKYFGRTYLKRFLPPTENEIIALGYNTPNKIHEYYYGNPWEGWFMDEI